MGTPVNQIEISPEWVGIVVKQTESRASAFRDRDAVAGPNFATTASAREAQEGVWA